MPADKSAIPVGSIHVALAREAIVAYVRERRVLELPETLPEALRTPAGAFVSLKKGGLLRGCIGTIEPACPSLAAEIVQNAIAAATRDPRFPPVQADEVRDLTLSVDVLSAPEAVAGLGDFDPRRYGMIIQAGARRGLLLPDLEGVNTVEEQFRIVCGKAGIAPGTAVQLYRFVVTRHH